MLDNDTNFFKIFVILLTIKFVTEFSEALTNVDYDFPEADEFFAKRTESTNPKVYSAYGLENSELPILHSSYGAEIYTAADSSIAYEVPCGVRGGRNGSVHNLNVDEHRIVGGIRAHPGEFPWQVSLQLVSGWFSRHICGGTILSSYWVITAGHCVVNLKPQALVIVAGDHDLFTFEGKEQRVKVVRIVTAGYSPENFTADLALLQLSPPLKLDGKQVAPICLPNSNKKYLPGEYGIVSGWGKLSEGGKLPHILHFVKLPMIANKICHQLYDIINYGKYINKCQLCCGYERGGSDSCQGDSGGPLVCQHSDKKFYLCGIVSWGVGCARPNLPGVYTEVPCYSDWIKSILYNVDNKVSGMPPFE